MRRWFFLSVILALGACGDGTTPYEWPLRDGFPEPQVPSDNPMTEEKVELGRHLFYDRRLSGNQGQSCASCHIQSKGFSDGRASGVGSTGEVIRRNSLALVNIAYNATLTWAHPELDTIERQLLIPMFGESPIELGISGNEDTVLERFQKDPLYQELFNAAYPKEDAMNFDLIVKALASFVRSLVSMDTPFDRYAYEYIDEAMTESQLRGMDLFLSEQLECHHCHGGFNFTQSTTHRDQTFLEKPMHNIGLYSVDADGRYPATDPGVAEITGLLEDHGKFRAPSLRNVALTGPYMHDGSIATLDEVIRFYEQGGRNVMEGPNAGDGRQSPLKSEFVRAFALSDEQRQDLVNFLHALTDEGFVTNPAFSNPFATQ
ncbi:MAG: MbnH family di-heme enzyme [Pseudomonadota bacterium]